MSEEPEPERELSRSAGVRDVVLGLILIGVGLVTRGTALDGDADRIDWFFDGLGVLLVLWGLFRVVRGR